ncbi:MAG: hypothetical protein EAX86_10440 [Candidatus Heimdallarchaeota archaeon]|nr:hypothetical protein [Candidatus Heimdallarchaeota archaeon]
MIRIAQEEYLLKICFVGTSKYKTQLIREYAEGKFSTNYLPTLGVDVTTKKIQITNNLVKLILVDTVGQEFFGKTRSSYYRGASIVLFVFDLIDRNSFNAISDYYKEFEHQFPESPIPPTALIGIEEPNKAGLNYLRQMIEKIRRLLRKSISPKKIPINLEEAKTLAEKYQMPYYHVSTEKEQLAQIILELAKQVISSK